MHVGASWIDAGRERERVDRPLSSGERERVGQQQSNPSRYPFTGRAALASFAVARRRLWLMCSLRLFCCCPRRRRRRPRSEQVAGRAGAVP